MHRQPAGLTAGDGDFTGMQPGPDLQIQSPHRRRHGSGASDRPCGTIEQRQEPVACGIELAPAPAIELRPHHLVVRDDDPPPRRIAHPAQSRGRIDDVGEEDRGEDALVLVGLDAEDCGARDLDAVERLVAGDPRVVPRRDLIDVARTDLDLRSVVHPDVQDTRKHVPEMTVRARDRPDDGLDILRPPPPGLPREPRDGGLVEVDDIDVPEWEGPDDVRRGHQVLPLQPRHAAIIAHSGASATVVIASWYESFGACACRNRLPCVRCAWKRTFHPETDPPTLPEGTAR